MSETNLKKRQFDINDFEVAISKETTGATSAYFPFGWITRKGAFIQDHAIEPGYSRIREICEKYGAKAPPEYFHQYWVRVDGMLFTAEFKMTKQQMSGIMEFISEFPHLYEKKNCRIMLLSELYTLKGNSFNGIYIEEN